MQHLLLVADDLATVGEVVAEKPADA